MVSFLGPYPFRCDHSLSVIEAKKENGKKDEETIE